MTQHTRQIFVASLITVSAISLPLILLYGSGYRINWNTYALQRTGSILVQTIPKNSVLTIFERNEHIETPTLVNHLPPQRYSLKITKENYAQWSSTADVKTNYTVNLGTVVLFLAEPETVSLSKYPKVALTPNTADTASLPIPLNATIKRALWNSEKTTLLYYTPFELTLLDTTQRKSRVILRQSTPITEAAWHPLEENIVYVAGQQVQVIETRDTDQPNIFTLYHGKKPHDLRFNKSGDTLYLTDEGKVLELVIM